MKFRRCPRVYVTDGAEWWLRAFHLYKKGLLPNGNSGWLHESNKYIEVMTFLDSQVALYQKEMSAKDGRQ